MKKQNIIVDTSIWIEYFKQQADVVGFIDEGLNRGTIFITGPIIAELLQGIKNPGEYELLSGCIDAVPFLQCEFCDWKEAGYISNQLRRKGLTIPLTDVIIGTLAIRNKMSVYTRDKHFSHIPGIVLT